MNSKAFNEAIAATVERMWENPRTAAVTLFVPVLLNGKEQWFRVHIRPFEPPSDTELKAIVEASAELTPEDIAWAQKVAKEHGLDEA